MPLLWFHALEEYPTLDPLDLLQVGPTAPGVDYKGTTQANEELLGISPGCVYAYLGMTLKEFGDFALALDLDAISSGGTVSPFDTGGLVAHIEPVLSWERDAKRRFLSEYSWPAGEIMGLLGAYPGSDHDHVIHYLDGQRPVATGPHEPFPGDGNVEAAIWTSASKTQAWLWEWRVPSRMPTGSHLVRWSCSNTLYDQIVDQVDRLTDPVAATRMMWVMNRFYGGGVGDLIGSLRDRQEAQ